MAMSRNEIQKRSNEKRGVRAKSYHLKEETIALIDRLAEAEGKTKAALLADAVGEYAARRRTT
ncbi:TPA: ribbon-helix-helix protein, CopG family [Neisseria bacilliformis]|jgi:identified by metaGeneAnnotator|uniref:ribbon-helix-helix protein, CopG family n=1 Tax=Neisseria bacilliformis TaxID=267212 RepID=UPI0028E75B99|nr:ribbon-helix-helix protein, CopG family [Neisseria bacilliformis]